MNKSINRTSAAMPGAVLWVCVAALFLCAVGQVGYPARAALIVVGAVCLCIGTWVLTVAIAKRESGAQQRHGKPSRVPNYFATLPHAQQIAVLAIGLGLGFGMIPSPRTYVAEYFKSSLGDAGGYIAGVFALAISGAIAGLILHAVFKRLNLRQQSAD